MQNNPSLGRPYRYEVNAALQALEDSERERERFALQAFYAMQRRSKPVLVVKRSQLTVLVAFWAMLLALGYAAYQLKLWLFPHM